MQVDYDTRMLWLSWIVFDSMHNADAIKRIRSRHEAILGDDFLWQDLILRHDFAGIKPWNAKAQNAAAFDHAMGNFWGMVNAMR